MRSTLLSVLIAAIAITECTAFVPPSSLASSSSTAAISCPASSASTSTTTTTLVGGPSRPTSLQLRPSTIRRRPTTTTSRISTRLHSLFGLGAPEIAIILLASLVVIGPSKLLSTAKEAGTAAGKATSGMEGFQEKLEGSLGEYGKELSQIPKEFQKGLEEGEVEARSRKAKVIKPLEEDKEE